MRGKQSVAQSGFTLVELLVAILIIGMIATIVTMNWRAIMPRTTLNSAVRGLMGRLQETRSDAIARNAEFFIEYSFEGENFDADEEKDSRRRGYRVITPYRAGGGVALSPEERLVLPWTPLPADIRFNRILFAGQEFTSGSVFVRFDPQGAASDHIIELIQDPFDSVYTIEVLALTGLIRFHEGSFERRPPDDGDFN